MTAIYQSIMDWIQQNPKMATLMFYHAVAMICNSLEMPDATSGKFYRFLFRLASRIGANYSRANASMTYGFKIPRPTPMPPPVQEAPPYVPPKV